MANTLPRQILLPEFLKSYQHWIDFADAIDEVFANSVDTPSNLLARIREVIHLGPEAQKKILADQIIQEVELQRFEREILIKCLTFVGCPVQDYTIFTDAQLFRLMQHLPTYWYSKGGIGVGEFVSFVLGVDVDIQNLWTTDYVNFYPEGSESIGLPIYEGGDWYPTSHVRLGYDPFQLTDLTIPNLKKFLYDMLNYNLVLHSIETRSEFPVVQISDGVEKRGDFVTSQSVALNAYWINYLVLSTDVDLEANALLTGKHEAIDLPDIDDNTIYVDAVEVSIEIEPNARVVVDPNTIPSTWSFPLSAAEVRVTVKNIHTADLHNVQIPNLYLGDLFAGEVERRFVEGTTVPLLEVGESYTHVVSNVFFAFYAAHLSSYTLPVVLPPRWISTSDDPTFTNLQGQTYSVSLNSRPPEQPCDPYFSQVAVLLNFDEALGSTNLVDESETPEPMLYPLVPKTEEGVRVFTGDAEQPIQVSFDTNEPYWTAEFLVDLPSRPEVGSFYGLFYIGTADDLTNPTTKRIQLNITPTGKLVLHLHDGIHQMNIESLTTLSTVVRNHVQVQRYEDQWWIAVNGKMTPFFTKHMDNMSTKMWIGTGFTTVGLASLPRPFQGKLGGVRLTDTIRTTADFFAPTFFPAIDCTVYANSLNAS